MTAGIRRIFLGWQQPLPQSVCRRLLSDKSGPIFDLSDLLIIVPTREAGRRLHETLVREASTRGSGLLPPAIETPAYLIDPGRHGIDCLSAAAELAHWAAVVDHLDIASFPALFPTPPTDKDFAWALAIGRLLRDLKAALIEGGHTIASARRAAGEAIPEPELWGELAEVEDLYLQTVAMAGGRDPAEARLALGRNPRLPPAIRQVVVAAVPDPLPLATTALARLKVPVEILVHAPEEEAAGFDPWGRPLAGYWNEAKLDLAAPHAVMIAADEPTDQARAVAAALADADGMPAAVCVADAELLPTLIDTLADAGIPAYDPAGMPLSRHRLAVLLRLFRDIEESGSCRQFVQFCRHPDILSWLSAQTGAAASALLTALDERIAEILPERAETLFLSPGENPVLIRAMATVKNLLDEARTAHLPEAVERLLVTIYGNRRVAPESAGGQLFLQAAAQVRAALDECAAPGLSSLGRQEMFTLLLARLEENSVYPVHAPDSMEVGGWLENGWQEAAVLVVAGMNEGRVPGRLRHSPFLPDSLATRLGLRDEAFVAGRDCLLLAAAVGERRRRGGRTVMIFGRRSLRGEPVLPSRLLFRCDDGELAERAARLFAPPPPPPPAPARTVAFALTVPDTAYRPPERLSVTALSDYLDCPFRFYLKHLLGMERLDAGKSELDALDFGALAHAALEDMGREPSIRMEKDHRNIAAFLADRLTAHATSRFGGDLPAVVDWQVDALRRRLAAAARIQAECAAEGWEIIAVEEKRELTLGGITLVGRIDRIDRHRESGMLRIIDYKTGDRAKEPQKSHLGKAGGHLPGYALTGPAGNNRAWIGLQLPLYLMMLAGEGADADTCQLAYWALPKAVNESGIMSWQDFSGALLDSALACAEGVCRDIAAAVFWPPTAAPRHDDFAELFSGPAESCFQIPDWFRTRVTP